MTAAVFCYDVVMVLECMSEEDWQIIRQGKPEIFTTVSQGSTQMWHATPT